MKFGNQPVTIAPSKTESLLHADILEKPLSSIYRTLQPSIHDGSDRLLSYWHAEVPELDTEDWEDVWDYPMHNLGSARDRLIQFQILHRIHLTPQRLHRIYPSHPSQCWRSTADSANFLHVFWECPGIKLFWAEVSHCICKVTTVAVPLSIDVCILELVHLLATSRAMRTLLGILLFYARKSILKWKSPQAPTLDYWKSIVNKMIPLYKFTYESRGCP